MLLHYITIKQTPFFVKVSSSRLSAGTAEAAVLGCALAASAFMGEGKDGGKHVGFQRF